VHDSEFEVGDVEEEDVLEVLVSKKIEGVVEEEDVAKELKSASLSILIRFLMVETLIIVVQKE